MNEYVCVVRVCDRKCVCERERERERERGGGCRVCVWVGAQAFVVTQK